MFEESSVYTSVMSIVYIGLRKYMFSCGHWFSSSASKGREGGFHFIVDYVFSFELQWGYDTVALGSRQIRLHQHSFLLLGHLEHLGPFAVGPFR